MLQYCCWHNDGKATMVEAIDPIMALLRAAILWGETDTSQITVELRQ
jgi:hypothetical protein